ncbi:hypothetical protein AC1031_016009 [Aphanomyces cochlioides]|nr:hypothetical protein AC1031_016009 [Aphanomyces cochlioides]
MSELNYKQFHAKDPKTGKNVCNNAAFLTHYPDMCIMFPPHSQKEWTMATTPWIAGPVWLISKGRIDQARTALGRLYLFHNTEAILRAYLVRRRHEGGTPKHQAVAYALLGQQLSGINAVMYYSASIFNRVGIHDPRYANTIVNAARLHDILLAAKLLDKFNRRTLLLAGMTVMALAGGGLVASLSNKDHEATHYTAVASMVLFVASYCISIGPISWIVANEIFPDFLNARAGAFGTFFTWVCNFLVGVYFQQMADPTNMGDYAFLTFSGCLTLAVVFVYLCVPETNHKSYREIQIAFGIDDPEPPSVLQDDDIWETEGESSRNSRNLDPLVCS